MRQYGTPSRLSRYKQDIDTLSKPKLLLLDEPSLGHAPKMTDFLFKMVLRFGNVQI
jgi:hypothetical protein